MAFEIVQIQPRIFYAKFDDCENMLLSTFRIDGARHEHKNEYENYPQYIKNYMNNITVSGYCIFSKSFRLFMRKFKDKTMTPEELEFTQKLLLTVGQSGINTGSKFAVIVCLTTENSITFHHEMAHSLFYVDYKYRMKVVRLFKHVKPDIKEKMLADLLKNDYKFKSVDEAEFIDEVNSRLATENLLKKGFSKAVKLPLREIEKFKKLYQDNSKKQ